MMISIYKPFIKPAVVLLLLILGMAFSASSISKQNQREVTITPAEQKKEAYQAKSKLARKLQRGVNMVTPGHKQFSPRFLRHLLKTTKVN